jgi:hypothetical protein
MPASYLTMWGMLILMALGAAVELGSPGDLIRSVRAAYPADTVKRDALHRCGQTDADFSRFSEDDREACYRVLLHASAGPGSD